MTEHFSSTPETGDAAPQVADAPERHRYEISVGGRQVGYAAYLDVDGQRIFYHTVIEQEFSGRGMAGRLVSAALEATRSHGRRVVPVCPYVAKYVKSHHDFDDIVDPVTPAALEAARAAMAG
jgi:uncharacterized protein